MKATTNRMQKTKTFLILLILCPILMYGQELIKKTKSSSNPNSKEIYYVLKSDKKTLHGSYKKFDQNNKIELNGFYKNGTKDSIWTEYAMFGKKTGKYMSDKKVGLWEFYDNKGKLEQSIDFSTNKAVYFNIKDEEKETKYKVISDSGATMVKLDQPPLHLDGSFAIFSTLGMNIHYPVLAQENAVSGRVEITFTIDSVGKTSNYRITKRIGSGCDEESLRVVKMIPENWLPGIYKGKAVTVDYVLPVNYKLQ